MADNTNAENKQNVNQGQDELVDLSSMDGDDVVSLSDEELDNILNTAEISETPIADIDIDLESDEVVLDSGTAPETQAAPAAAEPAPEEAPAAVAPEAAEEGFFDGDQEETISIDTGDLDTILDDASAGETASAEEVAAPAAAGSQPAPEESGIYPEAPVLGGDEEMVVGPPTAAEPAPVAEDTGVETSMSAEELEGVDDDDILMLDDEELVIEGADDLLVEETPVSIAQEAEIAETGAPAPAAEEVMVDIEEETLVPEPAPVTEAPAAAAEEEETPIVAVSGSELDRVVGIEEEGEPEPVTEPLEEFILEEELQPLSETEEQPAPAEEPTVEPVAVEEPAAEAPAPSFQETEREEDSVLIDLVDEPVEEPVAPAAEEEPGIVIEDDAAGMEEISLDFEDLPEEPAEPVSAVQPPAAPASEETVVVIGEPEPAQPDFQREADASLEQEEILIIDEEVPEQAPAAEEPALSIQTEEPEDITFDEVPVDYTREEGAVPVVSESTLECDEPLEIIDDELIYTDEEKIPVESAPAEPAPELISDADITEMQEMESPEQVTAGFVPAGVPDGESVQGLTEETKADMKKVLGYLDGLFDDLPEEKVKEFANSEYYDLYNKLFKELGI